jgi:capsid protein
MALFRHTNGPGYETKWFAPTRPNPNYAAFVEAFESRLAGALGMPRSVLLQQFNASYSAARGEIKFFWNSIDRRRDDFVSGFLMPIYEAWFGEHVRSGEITAAGYGNRIIHEAWLSGHWDGISMPQIDPLKEVNAIDKRLQLGHTTGEREAKKHNGSDFRSNVERLTTENQQLATAREPIQALENPAPVAATMRDEEDADE